MSYFQSHNANGISNLKVSLSSLRFVRWNSESDAIFKSLFYTFVRPFAAILDFIFNVELVRLYSLVSVPFLKSEGWSFFVFGVERELDYLKENNSSWLFASTRYEFVKLKFHEQFASPIVIWLVEGCKYEF